MNQINRCYKTSFNRLFGRSLHGFLILFVLLAPHLGFSQNQDANAAPVEVSKFQSVESQILSLLAQIEAGPVGLRKDYDNQNGMNIQDIDSASVWRDKIVWLSVALTRPLERRIEAYIYQRLKEVGPKLQKLIGQFSQDAGKGNSHQGTFDRESFERAVSMISDLKKMNELKNKAGKTHANYRLIFAYEIRIRSELMKVQNQYAGSRYALFCAGIF